ncbi:hypothetical protein EB118_22980 [bacterium]|nr:hypothetical protein [bacterium]NDG32919.1 hypothetical protein [bacterium]
MGVEKKEISENEDMEKEMDDVSMIFSGEELSEEFKEKAKAIFEAAVLSKVEEKHAELQEEFEQKLQEAQKEFTDGMVSKIDEYLDYVVSEWMEDNKLAIEKGLKAELVEDFMVGLKNLFAEHYVDIPEDKVDVVEEFAERIDAMEQELNTAVSENVSLRSEINNFKKDKIVHEVAEGLTDVQIAKLNSLSENVEFISEEDYKEKIVMIKKKYFESDSITEKKEEDDTQQLDEAYSPLMQHYVNSISRTLRK